ncbi:exopolysaccharide biosynthesis protein [Hyphomonas sp. WL0036]|uniref:exopolysaccharide biosynthesis protein n=1 Tax=Hyphomonas sediminis TaxID=2866160 RepID=UPI001C7FAC55|nr:exopolysaccharide biosynthesis protein [Hyphomonas sediminis]MBY9066362.1 exopolysaccharide biosynthesis protein [Hyphomonas sediminis]
MNRQGTNVPVTNLRTMLRSLVLNTDGDEVTVDELLHAIGRRAHGPVFLLLGFIAVSPLTIIPGANWFIATVILAFALQVVFGLRRPWMPKGVTEFKFKRDHLVQGVAVSERYAHMVDALVKPRLTFLTEAPFIQLVALICVFAALITYPLGLVPFGPLLPSLTVLLFGLALTARDGAVLLLAACAFGGAILLMVKLAPRLMALLPF